MQKRWIAKLSGTEWAIVFGVAAGAALGVTIIIGLFLWIVL